MRAIQKGKRLRWACVYLFIALGFLTKGPIAIAIPAGTLIVWMLWSRRSRICIYPRTGAAVFACIALPWYGLVYLAHGWTYIGQFFMIDNLSRYASENMGPPRGLFYYFGVYIADFFPWSLLLLLAALYPLLAALYQSWRTRKRERLILFFDGLHQSLRSLPFGLPVIWGLLIFLIFTLSKNKQEYYIAPLYPAAAIILSGILERRMTKHASGGIATQDTNSKPLMSADMQAVVEPKQPSRMIWTYGILACLILVPSIPMPYILGALIPEISFMLQFTPSLILMAGMGLLIRNVIRREYTKCFSTLAVPIWAIFIIGALFYIPTLESVRPVKSFCRQIEMQWQNRDEAGFFRASLPSMLFYLRRPIFQENSYERMMIRFRSEKQVFCILAEKDYAYFANQGLNIYILDRHSRFGMRLGDLLNAGYFPGDDLLLVSNRLPSQTNSSEGR
jgi:4-amino-4-deoxy-L-arabinose transferase-like glycosyltransferase